MTPHIKPSKTHDFLLFEKTTRARKSALEQASEHRPFEKPSKTRAKSQSRNFYQSPPNAIISKTYKNTSEMQGRELARHPRATKSLPSDNKNRGPTVRNHNFYVKVALLHGRCHFFKHAGKPESQKTHHKTYINSTKSIKPASIKQLIKNLVKHDENVRKTINLRKPS